MTGRALTGRLARLLTGLGLAGALAASFTGTAVAADGSATSATIDHAQPTDGQVRLLVSVPGDQPVDLGSVAVSIDGAEVGAKAATADSSDAVRRTTVLAIDTSDSMAGTRIAEAKKAATAYLDLVPENVAVGVLTFDANVDLVVPPTLDRDTARKAIDGLTLAHETALYDGLLGALRALGPESAEAGQRSVLVLSDGRDTTGTDLQEVLDAVDASGVQVDVVSLQGGAGNRPLSSIAEAGKGQVIDAKDPSALTDAFANEADALARQILVTADVPEGKATSANVEVSAAAGGKSYTASAYLPVRESASGAGADAPAKPQPVQAGLLDLPPAVMIGGVAAIGLGLLGLLLALAMNGPKPRQATVLSDQMQAYGLNAAAVGELTLREQEAQRSLAEQAKQAAERALANNRSLEAKIAHALEGAGMSLKPAEWLLLHGAIAIGGAVVGTLLGAGNILLGMVFFAVGVVGPWIYLSMKKSRRLRAFNSSLADTLQLMAGSLSAGLSLAQSIDTIVREGAEPITSEFKRVVIENRLGVTLEDSLEGVADRMDSQDFHWVVMAIRIQREVGGNLAELLNTVAGTLRERDYLRRHVKALSAEGRLSTWILGGLPIGFLVYLSLTKPDYVSPMYTRPIGWAMMAAIAVLLGVGITWMSKVSKVDL